jgi:hypothetical protein
LANLASFEGPRLVKKRSEVNGAIVGQPDLPPLENWQICLKDSAVNNLRPGIWEFDGYILSTELTSKAVEGEIVVQEVVS